MKFRGAPLETETPKQQKQKRRCPPTAQLSRCRSRSSIVASSVRRSNALTCANALPVPIPVPSAPPVVPARPVAHHLQTRGGHS